MIFFDYINAVKVYVFITFIISAVYFNKNKKINYLVFFIVAISLANEIVSSILKFNQISFSFYSSLCIITVNLFWLIILQKLSIFKSLIKIFTLLFLAFSLFNFFLIDRFNSFNSFAFIFGALIYTILFIYNSFYELKKENLDYFLSNDYLLISSPILYFIGFSFIFAFKNKDLDKIILFGIVSLYDFISYFVNFVYYTLINFYFFKEKIIKNAS